MSRCYAKRVIFGILLVIVGLAAGTCGEPSRPAFSGDRAYERVVAQCELGPRYPGSPGSRAVVDYISGDLENSGLSPETRSFVYGGVTLTNVVGMCGRGNGPVVLVGAHLDTRRYADLDAEDRRAPVLGANDGASGVAVLLELAASIDCASLDNEVWFVFFDGEDQGGIGGWPWSVGAERFASELARMPDQVIIVDMVGDAEQEIFFEYNSDAALLAHIWAVASELGYGRHFVPVYRHTVMDDHVPFARRGARVADIIDIDYAHWHTREDTPDKVSPESLERVGRVLEAILKSRQFVEETR